MTRVQWVVGALGAILVAGAAYAKGSLSGSGMLAAILMGTIYYGAGNAFWFGILLVFFITSSALSRWRADAKAALEEAYDKTGRRDAGQVMANGGIGMVLCLAYWLWPDPVWIWLFVGAMATVTADTWATEIGSLSQKPPRSVLTGRIMPTGASGGVSLLGTLAAAAGGVLIGLSAWGLAALSGMEGVRPAPALLAGLAGGLAGAFADSLLGASVQRMNRCAVCGREVESAAHCGQPTLYHRGWRWMNNDAVNIISSAAGAGAALLIGWFL